MTCGSDVVAAGRLGCNEPGPGLLGRIRRVAHQCCQRSVGTVPRSPSGGPRRTDRRDRGSLTTSSASRLRRPSPTWPACGSLAHDSQLHRPEPEKRCRPHGGPGRRECVVGSEGQTRRQAAAAAGRDAARRDRGLVGFRYLRDELDDRAAPRCPDSAESDRASGSHGCAAQVVPRPTTCTSRRPGPSPNAACSGLPRPDGGVPSNLRQRHPVDGRARQQPRGRRKPGPTRVEPARRGSHTREQHHTPRGLRTVHGGLSHERRTGPRSAGDCRLPDTLSVGQTCWIRSAFRCARPRRKSSYQKRPIPFPSLVDGNQTMSGRETRVNSRRGSYRTGCGSASNHCCPSPGG